MASSYEGFSNSRHSCDYCRRIVIEPPLAVFTNADAYTPFNPFVNSFEFSLRETVEASETSCVLFQHFVRDPDQDFFHEPPSEAQSHINENPDRRILLHFQIEPGIWDIENTDPSYPSYVCSISWIWEWADEAKERPVWDGSDRFTYELCSEPEDPAAELVTQKPRYPYITTDITFKFIKECLKDCDFHHDCLIKSHSVSECEPGPSRLINVGSSKDENILHLTDADDTMRYVALSYCWGMDDSMKLTSARLDNWKKIVQFTCLPKTLQDAVICTRHLGLSYLWVDRLCIIQDDELDKDIEIAAMPRIFQGAYLTISAASAKSSMDGFLRTREEVHGIIGRSWIDLPYLSSKGARGFVTLKLSESCEDFNSPNTDAVDSRAWTMQEQMLSPRLLRFCTFHIVWKCKVQENRGTSEAIEQDQPGWSRERKGSLFDSRFDSWNNIIRDYTGRNLSCPSDKLIAISAVAQAYGSIHNDPVSQNYKTLVRGQTFAFETRLKMYLAGLWRHEMPFALCWWRPLGGKSQFRPLVQRAPSWSWAAVDGPLTYYKSTTEAI